MRGRCPARRISTAMMAVLAVAAGLTGFGSGTAVAAACRRWTVVLQPDLGAGEILYGVAVVPHTLRAWAAGDLSAEGGGENGLLLHWNGSKWQQDGALPSLDGASLTGVAAVSQSDAWAVGGYSGGGYQFRRTLILHWNGTRWQRVPGPSPGAQGNELTAVAAVSATDAWAVGDSDNGQDNSRTLIEHWNGKAWKKVASPNPETGHEWQDYLHGVAAISATDAWAVGYAEHGDLPAGDSSTADVPIIEHWNGTRWKLVPASASPVDLDAVTAISARNVWAVGDLGTEHWNGKAWTRVSSPDLGKGFLYGVSASSTRKITLAVGAQYPYEFFSRAVALYHC
jgi:hypothetical protein